MQQLRKIAHIAKVDVQLIETSTSNNIEVQCILEVLEEDPIAKTDFRIFKEVMTIMPLKAKKKVIYCEIATVISLMFERIAKNIERI